MEIGRVDASGRSERAELRKGDGRALEIAQRHESLNTGGPRKERPDVTLPPPSYGENDSEGRLAQTTALNNRLEGVQKGVEWQHADEEFCPECSGLEAVGHKDGCKLAQALAAVKEWRGNL